jgi:hypothetical protein
MEEEREREREETKKLVRRVTLAAFGTRLNKSSQSKSIFFFKHQHKTSRLDEKIVIRVSSR